MKKQLLLLVMMLLPMMAMADAVEIDGIYYNLITKGKIAEVTSNPNKYSGSVAIPEKVQHEGTEYSVKSIGNGAFSGCSGLTSITIPNSVTSIGDGAFSGCSGLQKVIVKDIAAWCRISYSGYDSNPLYYAHRIYSDENTLITELIIPNSVTSIGGYTFSGCSGLTSITIPNSVTSIGDGAFQYCSGLTSITIPNSVTSIGEYAFSGCTSLTSVTIPNSVTSIGDGAFQYCSGLTSITIPNSVTSIGGHAFECCSGLTSVTIPNSVTSIGNYAFYQCSGLTSITIPNSVTSIGYAAFFDCTGLTSITIPNSVTSIGGYAFYGCSGLTSITIPNSVTSIGETAFYSCTGLTSVVIGGGVKTISRQAFSNCPELTDVTCYAENVPSTFSNAFADSYIEYATLHVPDASINAYGQAEPWKNFKEIVGLSGTATQKCATPTIKIVGGGVTFECETDGVTFKWNYKFNAGNNEGDGDNAILAGKTNCHVTVYATKDGYLDSDVAEADVELYVGLKGDVNADGEVNVGDIVTTTNIMAGKDE